MAKPRVYTKPEPTVIDEALILAAVADQDKWAKEHDEIVPSPPLKPAEIKTLSLSFKSLASMANLGCLDSLLELRLDNNNITKIESLGHLHNLTWLDLSFNKITVIEGLEPLTKLTDLSLFNNQIREISGLSTLVNLDCLSLGNNQLTKFSQLQPLRLLPSLKSLNLTGNPMCTQGDYRAYCIAYIRKLIYLDYAQVEVYEVQAAKEFAAQTEELVELNERESVERVSVDQDVARRSALRILQEANIAVADTLYDDIMKDDLDLSRIRSFPGIQSVLDEFRDSFRELSENFKANALEANANIFKEVQAFQEAVHAAQAAAVAKSIEFITAFQKLKKTEMKLCATGKRSDLSAVRDGAQALYRHLLETEIATNEKIEELFEVFELSMNELRLAKLAIHQVFFRSMESFEAKNHESLVTIAENILKQAADDITSFDTLTDDMGMLVRDRESFMALLVGCHDQHVSTIIAKEDELTSQENKRCAAFSKEPRLQERLRNRERVVEIQEMLNTITKEMQAVEDKRDDDEDD